MQKSNNDIISALFLIIFLTAATYILRIIFIPDDTILRDQSRVVMYILDAVKNKHWLCQFDGAGDITSKPPMYNWLGAFSVLIFGANRVAYTFPAFIGSVIAAFVVWKWTFNITKNEKYSWLALLCYSATTSFNKQLTLIRTDALFTGLVVLTAYLVWKAWETDKGWYKAWLAVSFACLTKGPFAIILAFGGLTSLFFLKNSHSYKNITKGWWYGLIFPVIIAGTWVILCLWQIGEPFYHKIFISELYNHFAGHKSMPLIKHTYRWAKPIIYLLTRSLPWSPLFIYGVWSFFKKRPENPIINRGLSFILGQISVGLFFLIIASHKRGDLVFPLLPAVAIIEGITLGELIKKIDLKMLKPGVLIIVILFATVTAFFTRKSYLQNRYIKRGLIKKEFAEKILRTCKKEIPLKYSSAYELQCYLKRVNKAVSIEEATKLIADNNPVFIATENLSSLLYKINKRNLKYYIIFKNKKLNLGLVSNIPQCN